MRFSLLVSGLCAVTSAAVIPNEPRDSPQDLVAVTDQLLFSPLLPQFTARRNKKDPKTLNWESDGCSNAPDNPFGFPILAACQRHDFGYRNYKAQGRFNEVTRKTIDKNFKSDMDFQCGYVMAKNVCEVFAEVYYAAVRLFGGSAKRETHDELQKAYDDALARYNTAVLQVQDEGLLPVLT